MSDVDDIGRQLQAIIPARGPTPTSAELSAFCDKSGNHVDVGFLTRYLASHCGFKDVLMLTVEKLPRLEIVRALTASIEKGKYEVVRGVITRLVVIKMQLKDVDLAGVYDEPGCEWKRDALLWILLPSSFRSNTAASQEQLHEAEAVSRNFIVKQVRALWGKKFTRQDLWAKILPEVLFLARQSQQGQSIIEKLRGGLSGDPSLVSFDDIALPSHVFAVASERRRLYVGSQIQCEHGTLRREVALRYDGAVLTGEGEIVDEVGLVVYSFEPQSAIDQSLVCCVCLIEASNPDDLWECSCSRKFCMNCVASIILARTTFEDPLIRRGSDWCPFCYAGWDIPDMPHPLDRLRAQVYLQFNLVLTLNNFQCPTGLSELVLPKVLPFDWAPQTILSAIWRYAYLYEYGEALKLQLELQPDVSPIDALVHRGHPDFWPCTPLLPLGPTGLLRDEEDQAIGAASIPYSPASMEDLSECSSVRSQLESSVAHDGEREDGKPGSGRRKRSLFCRSPLRSSDPLIDSMGDNDDCVEIDPVEIQMDDVRTQYRGSSAGGEDQGGPGWSDQAGGPDNIWDSADEEAGEDLNEEAGPGKHSSSCDKQSDPIREEQTRLRRKVVEEVKANGRRSGQRQRNLQEAAYRADQARDKAPTARQFESDAAQYYISFIEYVRNNAGRCRGNDKPLLVYADSSPTGSVIVFLAERNARHVAGATGLILDATFSVSPRGYCQLLVGLMEKFGYYVPLFYCLMSKKSEEQYIKVLLKVRDTLTRYGTFDLLKSLYVISDNETALRSAASRILELNEGAMLQCKYHLVRSWMRYLAEVGLVNVYFGKDCQTKLWLKESMGLPWLPPSEIPAAWGEMKSRRPPGPAVSKYIVYLESNYLLDTARFKREEWASEPTLDNHQNTTNPLEGFNRDIGNGVSSKSSARFLCDKILSLQVKSEIRLNSIEAGEEARSSRSFDAQRHSLFVKYRKDQLSRKQYLRMVAELAGLRRHM
ncbi:hypothetical protein FOZ62_032494 [Perkinsus olseni]|uniref:RING-type domain-containing protein n=1 Tax=Perkinsus olseni TaxID=32597 RepID=A0A7J6SRB6_PEROL|nr:hypothetical protein FOZ62_032494 [Perkinsus olseni]